MAVGSATSAASTGLDVDAIVTQLMTVERQPLAALDTKIAAVDLQVSALGTIRSKTSALRAAIEAIETPTNFSARTAASSRPGAVAVTASAGATVGTVQLEVRTTALADTVRVAGYASAVDPVGSGTLTIASGTERATFTVVAGQTLSGLRDQINADAKSPVRATVVQTASGQWSLVLAAKASGAASVVTVSATPGAEAGAGALSALSWKAVGGAADGPGASQVQPGRDASLRIDGIEVTRATNRIDDVVPGLAIELLEPTAAADFAGAARTTLTVARASSDARTRFEALAAAYNDLATAIADNTRAPTATRPRGALSGDLAAQTLLSKVRSMMGEGILTADGTSTGFYALGLRLQNDGTIRVDGTVLSGALTDAFVDRLGNGAWVGLRAGTGVPPPAGTETLRGYLRGALLPDGLLQVREDSATAQRKAYADRKSTLETRLGTVETAYRRRFSSLDAMLSRLNVVSSGLKSALDQLASTYTQKD
jgi:flagellar hook-associated protein 2